MTNQVSVVIPAFNAADWIGAALTSVVRQSYSSDKLDIVVVVDGSTDRTEEVATRTLAASPIPHAVLRNQVSEGPSGARNRGWRHARSRWIQFLDADDLLEPSKIERQVNVALSQPDGAVFYSPWGRLRQSAGEWKEDTSWVDPTIGDDPLLDVLRSDNFMQLGSLLFSRTALETIGGFNSSYRLIEDVECLMRVAMNGGRFVRVPSERPLSWYRQREQSLSRQSQQRFIYGCVRNAQFAEGYWRERDQLTPDRVAAIVDVYSMAIKYYADHDTDSFETLTQTLLQLQPAYTPRGSLALRLLTRVGGYERAERYAARYRRFKRALTESPAPASRFERPS